VERLRKDEKHANVPEKLKSVPSGRAMSELKVPTPTAFSWISGNAVGMGDVNIGCCKAMAVAGKSVFVCRKLRGTDSEEGEVLDGRIKAAIESVERRIVFLAKMKGSWVRCAAGGDVRKGERDCCDDRGYTV